MGDERLVLRQGEILILYSVNPDCTQKSGLVRKQCKGRRHRNDLHPVCRQCDALKK